MKYLGHEIYICSDCNELGSELEEEEDYFCGDGDERTILDVRFEIKKDGKDKYSEVSFTAYPGLQVSTDYGSAYLGDIRVVTIDGEEHLACPLAVMEGHPVRDEEGYEVDFEEYTCELRAVDALEILMGDVRRREEKPHITVTMMRCDKLRMATEEDIDKFSDPNNKKWSDWVKNSIAHRHCK